MVGTAPLAVLEVQITPLSMQAPTAIRAAANCFCQLLVSQSDNNVKLIVLDRLQVRCLVSKHAFSDGGCSLSQQGCESAPDFWLVPADGWAGCWSYPCWVTPGCAPDAAGSCIGMLLQELFVSCTVGAVSDTARK